MQEADQPAIALATHCREAGVRPFVGSLDDRYENAYFENFFATLTRT